MKLLDVILFITLCAGFISCGQSDMNDVTEMKFQNLDGSSCNLVLTLELGDEFRTFDPLNISDFDINPSNGLEVLVVFEEIQDQLSDCAFAEPINVVSISLK